jgi:Kdo2-lipid IVA lauroyltransferase/acyltransferase
VTKTALHSDHLPPLLRREFLHPRYWLTWLGFGLAALVTALPHRGQIAIGAGIGALGVRLAQRRRHIVEVNIALCFPELSQVEQQALVRKTMRSVGISLIETARVWIWNPSALQARTTIHGIEHLHAAVAQGRGVILLGMHLSTLDFCGAALGNYIDMDVMYRANANPLLETIMTRGRMRNFPRAIERNDVRGVLQSLKQGHVFWYGADQDYGRKHSEFVPFFGVQAATITATSRFAQLTGAPVVVFSHYRRPGDNHYDVYLSAPLTDFPSQDVITDATRINQIVETAVRLHPEQYWWVHRRFKTRPEGQSPPY